MPFLVRLCLSLPLASAEPKAKKTKTVAKPAAKKVAFESDVDELARQVKNCKLGLIEHAGPDANVPPVCPVFHKGRTDAKEVRLCSAFMLKGFSCRFGSKKCKLHHLTAVTTLSSAKQHELAQWVSDTPHLSFATGKAPPGT